MRTNENVGAPRTTTTGGGAHPNGSGSDRTSRASREDGGGQSSPLPSLSLPVGGGAIRGIGEKFTANPVTGTGSTSIPIAISPGRSGFEPSLAITYDSGSGNGVFGLGWSLSLPSITRKTDKGLPRYIDDEESDIFILAGAEDLVPALFDDEGTWKEDAFDRDVDGVTYHVRRYRPRIEGLFSRIERWSVAATGETHWRTISRDNVTTIFGATAESRLADPEHPEHVFSWLISESHDDRGNAIRYQYKAESAEGIDAGALNERNRTNAVRAAARHPKRIFYGNRTPWQPGEDLAARTDWMFEVVFDYGEHYAENPQGEPVRVDFDDTLHPWPVRRDPFSRYRSGFEVRSYRLCRNVLMFHHFPEELGVDNCLVRATSFTYDEQEQASYLIAASQAGYVRRGDGTYLKRAVPPVELEYSRATIEETVREVDPSSLENLPSGLDGGRYQWVDLDGEGLSGILSEQGEGWFYKRNLSALPVPTGGGGAEIVARFGAAELVSPVPAPHGINGRQRLVDLAGDGSIDLVAFDQPLPGFFERTDDDGWKPFMPFRSLPNISWADPNLKMIDLTGDGHADILVAEDEAFLWYQSLGEDGFSPAERVLKLIDEEKGPRLVFADGTQSIYLADLSGDGLVDIARVRNGEVCYWPNLGYGRFGAKVGMDAAPWFDLPDRFDQRRVRLVDVDGSGTTDILYLGTDGVHIYFNRAGNRWSDRVTVSTFPAVDDLTTVMAADLLGIGTACLVWSSPLPSDAGRAMRYIDLMGSTKPNLLVRVVNNLGAETEIAYAPSTKFYLADREAGRPWATRLPFPVHVVERVEIHDRISRNRFVTRYAYHHGYFDGEEREFRGFGMVEQWDTEEYATLAASDAFPSATNIDAASHVPPLLTKTWHHTGAWMEADRLTRRYAAEYYRESDASMGIPGLSDPRLAAMLLEDTLLPAGLSVEEERQAARALKGAVLRREVYALDGTEAEDRPYTISEMSYTIVPVQPLRGNPYAVFLTHQRESVELHYERMLYDVAGQLVADPRVGHAMNLEIDAFGNVLRSVTIGYGRRHDDPDPILTAEDRAAQKRIMVTYGENEYTVPVDLPDDWRAPLPCDARAYELLKVAPAAALPGVTNLFRFDEMLDRCDEASDGAHDIPYHDLEGTGATEAHPYRRLIERSRTLYRSNDLSAALPPGHLESLALPFESYRLALTPELVAQVHLGRVGAALLGGEARYVHLLGDGDWWIPSGRVYYSTDPTHAPAQELAVARDHFFLVRRFRDPFDHDAVVDYDPHDLLLIETRDPLGNVVTARTKDGLGADLLAVDYRVLKAWMVTDENGGRGAIAFDALGAVAGTAVMGKLGTTLGDSLAGFVPDLDEATLLAHLADPLGAAGDILKKASTRILSDPFAYYRTKGDPAPRPAVGCMLQRLTHDADLAPGDSTEIRYELSYSDGFGRVIQSKGQAEPGPLVEGGADVDPRWVGSGWTIYNNKGMAVRRYEPFFSATHRFEFAKAVGVSPIIFHDPVGRVVATLNPNHTYEKVVFDPWRQATWDVNDTVTRTDPKSDPDVGPYFRRLPDAAYLPTWYTRRIGGAMGAAEQSAAQKAAAHAETPAVSFFDAQARAFIAVGDNGASGSYVTRIDFDSEGNQRRIRDAEGRAVIWFDYDMLGGLIHQKSMEAGDRWIVGDAAGHMIRKWDSRGHVVRMEYDTLRRPTATYLSTMPGTETLVERIFYGEMHPDSDRNLRGRVYQHYDQSGVATTLRCDFKNNVLESGRRLALHYKEIIDWGAIATPPSLAAAEAAAAPLLESELFISRTWFDALSRPVMVATPHASGGRPNVIMPGYNEAGLIEKIDVWLRRAAAPTALLDPATADLHAVVDIDYDAHGEYTRVEHGNGVVIENTYDEIRRLTRRLATRPAAFGAWERTVQDLRYVYDPVGNLTRIQDDADIHNVIFFRNRRVEPSAEYTYDPLYRLIEAKGREHLGLTGMGALVGAAQPADADDPRTDIPHRGDGNAVDLYTESYEYDRAGNLLRMIHAVASGGWTRRYDYGETSLIEGTKKSNRLSGTSLPTDLPGAFGARYDHDEHGNIIKMPHLPVMRWDYLDRLSATSRQVVISGTPETTYYRYNNSGERTRKVTERQASDGATPKRKEERIYLGPFEIYRAYDAAGALELERETLHVMSDAECVALVESRTAGDDGSPERLVRYQYENEHGSASLELDAAATVVSYEEYFPYGSTSYQAVDKAIKAAAKRYRHVGKERDEENGFYFYGARYYASWLGRWCACDPSGIEAGNNLYEFCLSNPIRYHDPDGHSWRSFARGVLIGAGTALVVVAVVAAAPITIPASVATGLAVVGGAATVGTVVQSVRQRDLLNRPISRDQADEQLGTVLGGAVVGGFSGPTASGLNRAANGAVQGTARGLQALETSMGGMLPAAGPRLATAVAAPLVRPVTVVTAAGVRLAGTAVTVTGPLAMAMSNNNNNGSNNSSGSGGNSGSGSGSRPPSDPPARPPRRQAPQRPPAPGGGTRPARVRRTATQAAGTTAGNQPAPAAGAPAAEGAAASGSPAPRLFRNQMSPRLADELETAANVGVRPVTPNDRAFLRYANEGKIKWAITQEGELRIIPAEWGGEELFHSVLTRGAPVQAAGEANIAVSGGRAVGLEITPHSGHFMFGNDAATNAAVVDLGRAAFGRFGITFPVTP